MTQRARDQNHRAARSGGDKRRPPGSNGDAGNQRGVAWGAGVAWLAGAAIRESPLQGALVGVRAPGLIGDSSPLSIWIRLRSSMPRTKQNASTPFRGAEIAVVDLFCGVGGLTLGLKQAGLRVVAGYDLDADCEYPFSVNNNVSFICEDVAKLRSEELTAKLSKSRYSVIAGCAPCQPFSTYARTRATSDGRWCLVDDFVRHVTVCLPDVATMENVPQLTRHSVFRRAMKNLSDAGYTVWWKVVECADYGVPQTRKRLVVLASRHGHLELAAPPRPSTCTVRTAIGRLPRIRAGEASVGDSLHRACALSPLNARRIKASKQGGSWRDWSVGLRAACHRRPSGATFPSVYARMAWDEPGPTMTTQYFGFGNGRFGHPEQDRAISLREGALLQTFPRDYRFEPPGSTISAQRLGRLIGNAVPPKLAVEIGRSIRDHLAKLDV